MGLAWKSRSRTGPFRGYGWLDRAWRWAGRSSMPPSSRRRGSATATARSATSSTAASPEAWKDKPAKLAQKDRDARWTVKFSKGKPDENGASWINLAVPAFGYKNHITIDREHGLIPPSPTRS